MGESTLATRGNSRGRSAHLFTILPDPLLNLVTEVPEEALNGPRSGVSQSANSVPLNLLRQLPEHVHLLQAGITNLGKPV